MFVCVGSGRGGCGCGCGLSWEQLVLSLAEYCTFVSVKGVCVCIRTYVHCCTEYDHWSVGAAHTEWVFRVIRTLHQL